MIHLGLRIKTKKFLSLLGIPMPYRCLCCGYKVNRWEPWGGTAKVYSKHKIVGGGFRLCRCPICDAIDRHRWLEYVLSNYTEIYKTESKVLHFAPEKSVRNKLRNNQSCWYISGDIDQNSADFFMDITDIPFKDNWFDFIIANHVLSYIEDEATCFNEIKRCLKENGILIISFPICFDFDTYSKVGMSIEETEAEFGVTGNCRMYGKDYKDYLEKFGIYVIESYRPMDLLSRTEIEKYGLLADDILLFCSKHKKNDV